MGTPAESIQAAEDRAFALRRRMSDVLGLAGVRHPTWSRAKRRGRIDVDILRKVEDALEFLEREALQARDQQQAVS